MCHATSAGRKAGSVSTNESQFVITLSTNKAYLIDIQNEQTTGFREKRMDNEFQEVRYA